MKILKVATLIAGLAVLASVTTSMGVNREVYRILTAPYELVIAVETGFKMRFIESKIWSYKKQYGKFPPEPVVDAIMQNKNNTLMPNPNFNDEIKDPWDKPFLYRRMRAGLGYELVCTGADGKLRTKDDVVFRYEEKKK